MSLRRGNPASIDLSQNQTLSLSLISSPLNCTILSPPPPSRFFLITSDPPSPYSPMYSISMTISVATIAALAPHCHINQHTTGQCSGKWKPKENRKKENYIFLKLFYLINYFKQFKQTNFQDIIPVLRNTFKHNILFKRHSITGKHIEIRIINIFFSNKSLRLTQIKLF